MEKERLNLKHKSQDVLYTLRTKISSWLKTSNYLDKDPMMDTTKFGHYQVDPKRTNFWWQTGLLLVDRYHNIELLSYSGRKTAFP